MKIKYKRLTKEDKTKVKKLYFDTPKGKALKSKLRMVLVCAIGLMLCAIGNALYSYYTNNSPWDYAYSICLAVSSLFFFIAGYKLKIKRLNEYVINNKIKL